MRNAAFQMHIHDTECDTLPQTLNGSQLKNPDISGAVFFKIEYNYWIPNV